MRRDDRNVKGYKYMNGILMGAAILALGFSPLGASAQQGQSEAPPVMNQQAPPQSQQLPPSTPPPIMQQGQVMAGQQAGAPGMQQAQAGQDQNANQPLPPTTLTLPAGTMIQVRTTNFLSSNHSKVGEEFTATLDQPLIVSGWVVARRRQTVMGRVVSAKTEDHQSELALELTELSVVDGQQIPLKTVLVNTATPNAGVGGREVAGVATTTGVGAAIGAAAGGGAGAGIGAGVGAFAGIAGVLLTRGRPTVIPPESVLTFRVDAPITINTEQGQLAYQPVGPDDYGSAGTVNNGQQGMRRPYYYGGGPGYPPPPYYYAPYPYYYGYGYGYGFFPPPAYLGFAFGFRGGPRFGPRFAPRGFRR